MDQRQQTASCLTRFRSAPSSYFDTILNNTPPPPPPNTAAGGGGGGSGPNIQQAFARLIADMGARDSSSQNQQNPASNLDVKQEPQANKLQGQMNYSTAVDNSCVLMGSSANPGGFAPVKMNTGVGNSSITRYNSSPAGFFDQFNITNEYSAMRDVGNYGEASFSSPNTFKNRVDLSSGHLPSSSREINAVKEEAFSGDTSFNEGEITTTIDENYLSSFPIPSWDGSDLLSDDFLKVTDEKPVLNVKAPDFKNTEGRSRPPRLLSHHLSLPAKTSAELSNILEDSVPFRARAKRGCATHPRSIAERVRRTRISERMRKLQELVPNMDQQTNTADMLDLAVEYIKDLEKQVKRLGDNRAKCRCSNK